MSHMSNDRIAQGALPTSGGGGGGGVRMKIKVKINVFDTRLNRLIWRESRVTMCELRSVSDHS